MTASKAYDFLNIYSDSYTDLHLRELKCFPNQFV